MTTDPSTGSSWGASPSSAAYVVLSATVMPWYLLWVLPFAAIGPWRSWMVLTGMSLLSYLIYIDQVEHAWWLWLEFVTFFVVLIWEVRQHSEKSEDTNTSCFV